MIEAKKVTEDEWYEEILAVDEGLATAMTHCYLCEPNVNKRLEPKAGPLRGILRTSVGIPEDPTEVLHLSCGHAII